MVDIDRAEIEKFTQLGRTIDVPICADAGEFIEALKNSMGSFWVEEWQCYFIGDKQAKWLEQIIAWRKLYDNPVATWPGINPYQLMKDIAKWTTPEDILVSDTGTALGYLMQGYPFKGERFLHAFNMTPMGYGLPAAVGASFATQKRVILVTGDGSFMMSLAELSTVARWDLNIKIILLNNQGHNMCKQTERQWFDGKHASTTVESGLGFPEYWPQLADSFGIRAYSDYDGTGIKTLSDLFRDDRAAFMEVDISPDAYLIPQARFGKPLEDADPPLPRDELRQQMLIPLVDE
jgi:acetolactate synthase-1/2/3 large subunit